MAVQFSWLNDECMFFIGGNDTKANNAAAGQNSHGGCLKSWWDAEVAENGAASAMSKLMETDGDSPYQSTLCGYTDEGGGEVRITAGTPGSFAGVEIGMIAYCTDDQFFLDNRPGHYTVTGIDDPDGDYIIIKADWASGITPGQEIVKVGGAWANLALLANEISAGTFSQEIHINKDLTPITATAIAGYGDETDNTWLKILGFNTLPGDIVDLDGDFYQSVLNAHLTSVDADKFVDIGSGALADHLFNMDDVENVLFSGIHFSGTGGTAKDLFFADAASINHVFKHCVFSGATGFLMEYQESHRVIFDDVFLDAVNAHAVQNDEGTTVFRNTIVELAANRLAVSSPAEETVIVSNLLTVGGEISLNLGNGGNIYAFDYTAVGATADACLRAGGAAGTSGFILSLNNILVSDTVDVPAVSIRDNGLDASIYVDGLCAWSLAGQMTNVLVHEDGSKPTPEAFNVIEEDPEITDGEPANKNLRLINPFEQWEWLGAIQPAPQTDPPVITGVTDDGTGTSFTAAVTGSGTIQLYYKLKSASSWTAGESRSGNGDIQQTGLSAAWYECYATATDNAVESGASNIEAILIESTTAPESIEVAIVSILEGDTDVATLVGDRIYPLTVPQGVAMPALTYQQLVDDKRHTHSGPNTLLNTWVQIDCWAVTYIETSALKKAVRLALDGYTGTVAGRKIGNILMRDSRDVERQPGPTRELKRFGKQLDFEIVFNEASE